MSADRKPYVPPRLVQVQHRAPGDNLATGCKTNSSGGPTENPCDTGADPCVDANSS
jgi:hypothetical protein